MQNQDGPPTTGVTLETICSPGAYSARQLKQALALAELIAPNPLLLAVPPPHDCDDALDDAGVCRFCHRLYQD